VSSVDPAMAVDLVPSGAVLSGVTRQSRFGAAMASSISGVALALTVVGILGIFAYVAEERRGEIGIRVALGAGRSEVFRLLLTPARTGHWPGASPPGCSCAGTGWLLGRFLYGLSPLDPFSRPRTARSNKDHDANVSDPHRGRYPVRVRDPGPVVRSTTRFNARAN
jgi:hypothetical protein